MSWIIFMKILYSFRYVIFLNQLKCFIGAISFSEISHKLMFRVNHQQNSSVQFHDSSTLSWVQFHNKSRCECYWQILAIVIVIALLILGISLVLEDLRNGRGHKTGIDLSSSSPLVIAIDRKALLVKPQRKLQKKQNHGVAGVFATHEAAASSGCVCLRVLYQQRLLSWNRENKLDCRFKTCSTGWNFSLEVPWYFTLYTFVTTVWECKACHECQSCVICLR